MLDFHKLATNFSFLVFGEAISKVFTFVAFALLARTFGPLEFGHLEFVLAVMLFATLLVDFGSNPLGSREVAKAPYKNGEIVAGIFGMRLILAVFAYCLLFGFVLIPIYAQKGAAFSLVSAVTVYCLLVYIFVKMFVHQVPFLSYVYKALLTGAAMVVLFFTINTYKLWIAICVCNILYLGNDDFTAGNKKNPCYNFLKTG